MCFHCICHHAKHISIASTSGGTQFDASASQTSETAEEMIKTELGFAIFFLSTQSADSMSTPEMKLGQLSLANAPIGGGVIDETPMLKFLTLGMFAILFGSLT